MKRLNATVILGFLLGVAVTVIIVLSLKTCRKKDGNRINQDYYVLSNQISKMDKMVVAEQDFSSFQTNKSSLGSIGGYEIMPKEMVLYTTAKAQVSYDLSKMKIDVDSVNRKLLIREIPPAEIRIFPDVKIHFMDDYMMNRYTQAELNGIMESAKKNMVKSVDQEKLRTLGREQLMKNLSDIFVLAKALHYQIVDETGILDKSKL